jgi:amino acid transporter/signal transduction histidine kinase
MRSVLGLIDIAASTMANIAPAMSFYFGFGFLALTAGVASPLTIVVAAIAIALLGNTLAEFSRARPSTGSFITFIGKAFGPTSAIATAVILITGYIVAIASVIVISGGFTALFLHHYAHWVPTSVWPVFVVVFVCFGAYLMVRGIYISTRWAGYLFAFEMIVLLLVTVSALVHHAGHLTLHPFMPHYLSRGWKGLGLGFPLAVYLFVGWENSAALAEETDNPRRNVPRAVYTSIAIMAVGYLLFAYATVEGFSENVSKLSHSPIPFMAVASGVLGVLAFFAYLAGVTSTLACVISAVNSQSRLLFNAGREGLLPSWLGRVHAERQTPVNALLTFIGIGFVLVFAWAYLQHIDPVTLFAQASTLGTIMVVVVYLVANLALPVFYRRYQRSEFRVVRHLVIPLLGAAAILLPLYELVKPGQAHPYDWFPYISLAVIVAAVTYAVWLNARDKTLADRVGSFVADDLTEGKFTRFLDQDNDRLHSLCRILACLNQDRDLGGLLREALPLVAEALSVDSVTVFEIKDPQSAWLVASFGDRPGTGADSRELDLSEPALAALLKRPHVAELARLEDLPAALSAIAGQDCDGLVIAPAAAGREITGLLVMGHRGREPLVAHETEFAAAVADAIGLVLHSRLLTEESQHTAAVLQTAYAVSRAITQSLELESTYREIAANAARVAPGAHCLLFELEREGGDLTAVACSDPESEQLLGVRARLGADGASAHRSARPRLVFDDVREGGSDGGSVSKFGAGRDGRLTDTFGGESSVVVPLFAQQELVGSLLVYAVGRRRRFAEPEIAELRAVGEQAAIAIHNAQLFRRLESSQSHVEDLLRRLTQIREQERQALARTVHDDIVQSIVGAIYRLDDFRDTVAPVHTAEFDEALAVLRRSVDDARRVIWELRPPVLDGLGFPEALRSLAEHCQVQGQASLDASIEGIADLSDGVGIALYKIAREALLNSVRHAGAGRISLQLAGVSTHRGRAVRLRVEDDGVGFERPERFSADDHYGMVMMEEQATLVGGSFAVSSTPARGTMVEVVVPLLN